MTGASVTGTTAGDEPVLRAVELSKRFEGVHALREVDLEVRPGEIHALLGENGAGKSTLIKALTGVIHADEGSIEFGGEPVRFHSVQAAALKGVVALYQELAVIPTLSVAENVLLGARTPSAGGFVRWQDLRTRAQALLDRLGETMPLDRLAAGLSPVRQTMIALARALATDARVLILDEPTAALSESEATRLFEVLRGLRAEGVAIVYVSHRLEEVFELCDRYTIMRGGRTVATGDIASTTVGDVIRAMVGREPGELYPARTDAPGPAVLRVQGLQGTRVSGISFEVRAGEVLGIGGLAGSGRSELLRLIAGAQRRRSGTVLVEGFGGVGRTVAGAREAGIAYVPEERRTDGIDLRASIQDNLAAANLEALNTRGWVSGKRVTRFAQRAIDSFAVRASGPDQPAAQLSGGNQQKVVLAKVLAGSPRILLVDEPTRGIDVGARAEIYRLIRTLASEGAAVVMVSSDLAELTGLADRIIVLRAGHVVGEVTADEADDESLLALFYGRAA